MSEAGRLVIICGLPGSGKTTLARTFEDLLHGHRMDADTDMIEAGINPWGAEARAAVEYRQWVRTQVYLAVGETVIIEWGTWSRRERDHLRRRARRLGAHVELHPLTASPDVLFERIQARGAEIPPVTLDQVGTWAGLYQPPTAEELSLYDTPVIQTLAHRPARAPDRTSA